MASDSQDEPLTWSYVESFRLSLDASPSPPLVRAIALSPCGEFLATGYRNKVVIYRHSITTVGGQEIESWTIQGTQQLDGDDEELTCMVWAQGGVLMYGATSGDVVLVEIGETVSLNVTYFSKDGP